MKKVIALVLSLLLVLSFVSCSNNTVDNGHYTPEALATIISNRDYPPDEIEVFCKRSGFSSKKEAENQLSQMGLLIFVPVFQYEQNGESTTMGGYYTSPNTVLAECAREMGVIK